MCPPRHFSVDYSINTWMEPDKPTDGALALLQWEQVHRLLTGLGHRVDCVDPAPGLPDMVFAANAATVVDGKVLATRFRHAERSGEEQHYVEWLRRNGFPVFAGGHVNEGEGDLLVTGRGILAGTGYRTEAGAHGEAAALFGLHVHTLTLVDPRFYHLDTALAVLDDDEIMYYPGAFATESQELLRALFPGALLADEADAVVFGLNAVSDGRHVVFSREAVRLHADLSERGYITFGMDISELLKAGGGVKCCVLELRPARPTAPGGT
jgi:N-dimethylarginine dimethylaminohydrolase